MNQNSKTKANRIPYSVEFERVKRQFAMSLGTIQVEDQAYFFKKLSKFLDLGTYHQVGAAWRDCYTDPNALNRAVALVESLNTWDAK